MNQEPPQTTPETGPHQQVVRVALPDTAPYVTYIIIGFTVFVYLLQLASQALFQYDFPAAILLRSNELIRSGQLWRLVSSALVHGSLVHIGFNMYALFSFGTNLERHFGRGRFLLLYLVGAFTGNVVSLLFASENSLGASTAIFGLLGAETVFLYQNRRLFGDRVKGEIGNLIFIALFNLLIIGSLPGIGNWGHLGGLLGGLALSWFICPLWGVESDLVGGYHLVDRRPANEVMIGAVAVLFFFGAAAFWGIVR
jgi:rhomboid protease GluP